MRSLAPRLGLLLVVLVPAGCGPRTGTVTGRVTYKGNPVPAGWVLFQPADPAQNAISAELDADGNYSVTLPAGEVTVSIDNREWEPRAAGPAIPSLPAGLPLSPEAAAKAGVPKGPAPRAAEGEGGGRRSGKYVAIPPKYYDLATSGLKFKVQGGDQAQNLELTD
jgi:hypothetical protein